MQLDNESDTNIPHLRDDVFLWFHSRHSLILSVSFNVLLPVLLGVHVSVFVNQYDSTMSSPMARLFSNHRRICKWHVNTKTKENVRSFKKLNKTHGCYLKSFIWLCINFLMFQGRSLWPSIKGTCSRKWSAAWNRSSNGEPEKV